jgi:hypothetical protein
MTLDNVNTIGTLKIVVTGADGTIKDSRLLKNLVVSSGKALFASRLIGAASAVASHIAVGTNNTVEAVTQTGLSAELVRAALASTTNVTTTVTNDAVQYVATLAAGIGTGALVEAGIFNAASAGTMISRVVFPVVNKGAADTMTITWKITFA